MNLYMKMGNYFKSFINPDIGKSVVFEAYGNILASAIYRMSKSRYKVYVITLTSVFETICSGIGEANDILLDFYKSA